MESLRSPIIGYYRETKQFAARECAEANLKFAGLKSFLPQLNAIALLQLLALLNGPLFYTCASVASRSTANNGTFARIIFFRATSGNAVTSNGTIEKPAGILRRGSAQIDRTRRNNDQANECRHNC